MNISRDEKFTPNLQDALCIQLYRERGWKGVWVGLDQATVAERLILEQNR
jgi:hypothetical protein